MILSEVRMGSLRAVEAVGVVVCSALRSVGGGVVALCGFAVFASVETMDGVQEECRGCSK